jgi:hypothetical protein
MAAMFFKPDSDPRTSGDFAKDNFDFCMKTYIDKFMTLLYGSNQCCLENNPISWKRNWHGKY